jgi:putative transposase
MARYARLVVPGYPHHVTQRGVQKRQTFFKPVDYVIYLELLREYKEKAGVDVWAYCLMPNHIHAVVVPKEKPSLAKCFGPLHSRYATKINAVHGWQGHLWQQRFYSVVMDEFHTIAAMRYVEMNPVRAGMCNRPQDWRWSSAQTHLLDSDDDLVNVAATRNLVPNWRRYLGKENSSTMQDALRDATRIGRPVGNDEFIDRLERLTGRTIRRKKSVTSERNSGDCHQ